MDFLVICRDVADSAELRRRHKQAHLDYVETIMPRIQAAGPLVDKATGDYRSSCFIYTAETEEAALALLYGDPYYRAGIYASHTIEAFKAVAGNWVGGRNW